MILLRTLIDSILSFFAKLVQDWRRDNNLKQLGYSEAAREIALSGIAALDRQRKRNARIDSDPALSNKLRDKYYKE